MTIVGNPDDAGDNQVQQSGSFVLIKNRLIFFEDPDGQILRQLIQLRTR